MELGSWPYRKPATLIHAAIPTSLSSWVLMNNIRRYWPISSIIYNLYALSLRHRVFALHTYFSEITLPSLRITSHSQVPVQCPNISNRRS